MVEVEQGKSGQFWRMTYKGEVDYLDEEPTDADKNKFMRSVDAQKTRERIEMNTGGHTSAVERAGS